MTSKAPGIGPVSTAVMAECSGKYAGKSILQTECIVIERAFN